MTVDGQPQTRMRGPGARRVAAILVAVSAAALRAHGASSPPPVLANPGFEEGVRGWRWWFSPPDSVDISVVEGDRSDCVRFLGTEGTRVAFYQDVRVRPLGVYRIAWRYMAGPNGRGGGRFGSFNTRLIDPNGKHFDYPCAMSLLDTYGEWGSGETVLVAPLSADRVRIEFNSAGACDLRIDDVSVVETAAPERPEEHNTWHLLATPREEPLWFSSWQYILKPEKYRERALKYGFRYRHREQFELLKTTRTTTWSLDEKDYPLLAAVGVPACEYPYYPALERYKAHYGGRPPRDLPQLLDPVWHDCVVDACRERCRRFSESPGIVYVFSGDEVFGRYLKAILPAAERSSARWQEIDREVREQFGGGKHGLPGGGDDADPFRWIAYYSWVGREFGRTLVRMKAAIEESGCGAKLLGPDEAHTLYPWPWHEFAKTVDVFTGQSLPYRITAHRYNTGFVTKCYADMTGRPVHNATQIVMYAGSPSPEEVRRRFSQVLQNGGEGQMLIAEEWGDRELSHHQFSAPGRWATVRNLLALTSSHKVQTPTESRVGVLYSSPSAMALGTKVESTDTEAAYAFCGPLLGGWPRMVDSWALAVGQTGLSGLSVLIVPTGRIERPNVLDRLRSFVASGGLLVCCEAEAFSWDTSGARLGSAAFLGARPQASTTRRRIDMSWPEQSRQRVYDRECFVLDPVSGSCEVIGTYADGAPAATLARHGKGQVVVFGSNPLADSAVGDDAAWLGWWRAVLATGDVPFGLPIWQLRLPDEAIERVAPPDDVCVTGNSVVRCQNGVYLGANDAMQGHYAMSVRPDLSAESCEPLDGRVPFAMGDLTDRGQADKGPFGAMRVAKQPYAEAEWANRWSRKTLAGGLDVRLILPKVRRLTRVRFWFSGSLPPTVVEGKREGGWETLARIGAEDVGEDVSDVSAGVSGRHAEVRLLFGVPTGDSLALADVELWAEPE